MFPLPSKNNASSRGVMMIILKLAYNPCIEEVNLSDMSLVSASRNEELITALAKLFHLTISLKKVKCVKCSRE